MVYVHYIITTVPLVIDFRFYPLATLKTSSPPTNCTHLQYTYTNTKKYLSQPYIPQQYQPASFITYLSYKLLTYIHLMNSAQLKGT